MIYRLEAQSGPEGAAFGFQYGLPSWPTREVVFGSPLEMVSTGLSGSGSIRRARELIPKPVLRLRNGCNRGMSGRLGTRYWVEVPASSAAIVELHIRGTYPVWRGTETNVALSTFAIDDPMSPMTPLAVISAPGLTPKGTRIDIRTRQQSLAGLSPELVGQTDPPFRLARISLKAVRPSRSGAISLEDWTDLSPPAVPLGTVRTDRQGRFSVPPRPFRGSGPFAVIARSEARGERAADWNCGAFFWGQ